MMKRSVIVLLCGFLFGTKVIGQPGQPEEASKYSFNYTKIVPGMPENTSLGAYGSMPVSTAKGVPNISFDIYTLTKGGVNVPVSISYDASGIKYSDIPSSVGMKWSLNAGGSINRSVNGIVDEDFLLDNLQILSPTAMNYRNQHINSHGVQDTSKLIAKNIYDCSLDNYYYNFPGHSGSMYLNKHKIFSADKECSKILIDFADHLDSFSIRDDMGNTYFFGTYTDNSTVYNTGKYNKQAKSSFSARVSWKLNKIITATGQAINFEYTTIFYTFSTIDTERYSIYVQNGGDVSAPLCIGGSYPIGSNGGSFQTTQFSNSASLLSKIYTDDQEVLFEYVQNNNLAIFKKKLAAIKVYSKISSDTIKKFSFNYDGDYLTGFNELDRLTNAAIKKYQFGYNTPASFGPASLGRDIFGYYNGHYSNNSLIDNPDFNNMYYPAGIGSRTVNEGEAASGTLNEVTYPTGGKTVLTYEYNKETINGEIFYAPGLRVKSIWDLDGDNKVYNKKNFYYSNLQGGKTKEEMTLVNDPWGEPNLIANYHSDPPDIAGLEDYYYRRVVIKDVGNDAASGPRYEIDNYATQYELYSKISPLLIKKEIFLGDTFHLQKSIQYDYEPIAFDNIITYTYVLRKAISYMGYFTYENDPATYPYCPAVTIYQGYDTKHTLKPVIYNLKKVINREYTPIGDSLITTSENFYYTYPVYLQRTEVTGSDNKVETVKYSYSFNYSSGTPLAMSNSFIWAPVLKEEYLVNNVAKIEKENNYAWNSNGFYVQDMQTIKDVASNTTQILNYYDYNSKAKLLSMGRNLDMRTSYIWDYLNELPIAEVTNADHTSIAYTSFEADGKGNWQFTGSPAVDATSVTGKKTYALGNGSLSKTGLNTAINYTVTYWSKGAACTISGTQAGWPKTLATIIIGGQAWTCYGHLVTGQSTITLSGSATIDEVRLYPQGASMTTYSYQPLVGIVESCDANNRISYYEYDGLGRLLRIRDKDKNIIKQFDYQYQVHSNPTWQAISATRCKPCAQNANYTINILQSAQIDINPNSSSYGDTLWTDTGVPGSCVITPDWQYTATPPRCQTSGGKNTGSLEREKQDMNPCSPTYNQIVWGFFATNCTTCPTVPNWQPIGTYRCAKDAGNNNTGRRERQEINNQICSDSQHMTRWVDDGVDCGCPAPENWQPTGNVRCQKNEYNSNTGYQEIQEENMAACTPTFRWVPGPLNTTACALCFKCFAPRLCANDVCETGVKVYTASTYNPSTGKYDCTYHYEYPSGHWSVDNVEESNTACFVP